MNDRFCGRGVSGYCDGLWRIFSWCFSKSPQVESYLVVKVKYYQVFFLVITEVKFMNKMWYRELDTYPQ